MVKKNKTMTPPLAIFMLTISCLALLWNLAGAAVDIATQRKPRTSINELIGWFFAVVGFLYALDLIY